MRSTATKRRIVRLRAGGAPRIAIALAGLASPLLAQGYELSSLEGNANGERLGSSVANVGDLDGDGVPEIAVGGDNFASGIVKVFPASGGAALYTIPGLVNEYFGRSVAGIGDITGDGVPDFASAGYLGNVTRTYSGATGGLVYSVPGAFVAALGDVNGDAIPDLVVGSPLANANAGQARLLSGANGGTLFTSNGIQADGFFGYAVAGAGDVSGDGVPDAIVGGGGAFNSNNAGYARLISGATGGILFTFNGTAGNDHFGRSVAGVGDVNGDGVRDLAVGATQEATGPGYVRIQSGATGAALFTIVGPSFGSSFGTAVGAAGDLDGDGVSDVLVGAPHALGSNGQALLHSGANGLLLYAFDGIGDEWFGVSVAGAGDLDDDGLPDLLVGGRYGSPSGISDAGRALAISVAGLPLGSFLFGAGCPGSGGFVPNLRTAGGFPATTGNPDFGIFLSNALGGAPALLATGSSFQSWQGIPLPLNLGFLGAPACSLLVAADFLVPATVAGTGPGNGSAFLAFPIPANPALVASFAHLQWFVFDPGAPPFATSSGLKLLLL